MNGRGQPKAGQAGGGGHLAASRCRPGLSLQSLLFLFPAGGDKSLAKNTTAAAAEADAGVVFYQYVATGINAAEHYKEQARAASGFSRIRWRARAESVTKAESTLCSARGK